MPWRGRSGASKWPSVVVGFHFLWLWDLSLYTHRNAAYEWTVALVEEVGFLFHLPYKCMRHKEAHFGLQTEGQPGQSVCVCAKSLQPCPTLWDPTTVAHQAPLSMGFSRQEYWSGWPCPPPGDLPNPGIETLPLTSPAVAGRFFTTSTTWEAR